MFNMCCSGDCEAHTLALVSQCFYSHKIAAEVVFFLSHKPFTFTYIFQNQNTLLKTSGTDLIMHYILLFQLFIEGLVYSGNKPVIGFFIVMVSLF